MSAVTQNTPHGPARLIGFIFGFRTILFVLGVRLFGLDPQPGIVITLLLTYLCVPLAAMEGQPSRTMRSLLRPSPVRWAAAFLLISGGSLLWTVSVSRAAAAAYWCAVFADAVAVLFLLRRASTRRVASSLMHGYVYGACLLAAVAWILPAQSDLRLGDEDLLGPNQVGYVLAFAMFFALYLIRERVGNYQVALAFLAVTLLRSLSKTSILAFLAAVGWLLVRDRTVSARTKFWLSAAAIATVVAFSGLLLAYVQIYVDLGDQAVTLSGRLTLWAYILHEALDTPWFGHGFHSVWKVIPPMNGDFEARHAHNELLQQFYAYGVVGVVTLIGLYASFLKQTKRLRHTSLRALLSSLMIFVLVRGLTDTEVFDLTLPIWAVVLWSTLACTEPVAHDPGLTRSVQRTSLVPGIVTGL